MINKIDLRKAISSIAISNAKRNTIYKAFSDLCSITKEEFDSVKSDISKVVESMLTKDTVGKANGVASLDSNGSVPIEQLGNIDTTLFLIVRELPTADIKSNKIYLVPNQDGQGDNVYLEYLYVEGVWEKVGEFKPEVDLSYIEAKLDTKADIIDVDNRLDNLRNYCFKLGDAGEVAAPYKNPVIESNILQLNNNEEYVYADLSGGDLIPDKAQYIYDKNLNKSIKIAELGEEIELDRSGDFFRTSEPLYLTHIFYLDNEKTGIVDNLTQLNIEESNVFVNLPYVEVDDNLEDDETPQYIYDATDNKWIEVIETYCIGTYNGFNTEELLDLTHELYYSSYPNTLGNWMLGGVYSTAIGYNSEAKGDNSIAIGYNSKASQNNSIAIGINTESYSRFSTSVGYEASAIGNASIAIGCNTIASNDNGIAIGSKITIDDTATNSIAIGNSIFSGASDYIALGNDIFPNTLCVTIGNDIKSSAGYYSVAIGDGIRVKGDNPVAIGYMATANFKSSLALGAYSTTGGNYAISLGKNISNTKSIFGVGFDGVNGIDMDRDNYGLYLKGFGGYDGTNLVVKSGDSETLNPDIKSVQQIINEKADTSAIPTKVSQLTNDANFITSYTETDPVWTSEKDNYYTKTEIDNKGYLTAHQSLDAYAKKTEIPNISTKADLVGGKLKADQLPKLVNITTAATAEEVVTKFNDLLADLKAKGYMEADTPQ
jgi:hypothetical protein